MLPIISDCHNHRDQKRIFLHHQDSISDDSFHTKSSKITLNQNDQLTFHFSTLNYTYTYTTRTRLAIETGKWVKSHAVLLRVLSVFISQCKIPKLKKNRT